MQTKKNMVLLKFYCKKHLFTRLKKAQFFHSLTIFFCQVQNILKAGTSWAGRHKEAPGHHAHKSAIIGHLFGEASDGKLTIDNLLQFQDE